MFVRKKKNKSDVVSIQILEKRNGKSALVKTIGSSNDPDTVEKLFLEGRADVSLPFSGQFGFSKSVSVRPRHIDLINISAQFSWVL